MGGRAVGVAGYGELEYLLCTWMEKADFFILDRLIYILIYEILVFNYNVFFWTLPDPHCRDTVGRAPHVSAQKLRFIPALS